MNQSVTIRKTQQEQNSNFYGCKKPNKAVCIRDITSTTPLPPFIFPKGLTHYAGLVVRQTGRQGALFNF